MARHHFLYPSTYGLLISLVVALVIFGLLVTYSASFPVGEMFHGNPHYYIVRQSIYAGLGLLAMAGVVMVGYRRLRRLSFVITLACVASLAAVLVPGVGEMRNGAARWLSIGPLEFQPGEIAKVGLVLYMSAWLAGRRNEIKEVGSGLLPFALVVGLVAGLIVAEPDMGTAIVVGAVAVAMFFAAQAPWTHLMAVLMAGGLASFLLVLTQDYRLSRIHTFLWPDRDPLGEGYQLAQLLTAFRLGGLTGQGWGAGQQKLGLLPNAHTDGVFAVVGEELGLVGAVALLALILILAALGLKIALESPDSMGRFLAVGVSSWLAIQTIANVGGVTGLLPLTGVPLPFFSYGGSALVSILLGIGLLLSVAREASKAPTLVRGAIEVRWGGKV